MPCLVREDSKKFLEAIKDGRITPEAMLKATSKERQAILGKIIGEGNAGWVNAALEEKILLKDQNRGMATWARKVGNVTPAVRRDLLTTVQKNKRIFEPGTSDAFLESLAAKKLGAEITFDEAKKVSDLAARVKDSKAKLPADIIDAKTGETKNPEPFRSPNRQAYGDAVVAFKDYVDGLKLEAGKVGGTIPEKALWYAKHPVESVLRSAGAAKSFLSTLDNSYFGRQGIKMLFTNPDIWGKNFLKSWHDIGKELIGRDAMGVIKSDVYSRPNALNGKYDALKLDIGIGGEEAFPSSVLNKIPLLGRVPKAAESAFNGAALRFRADLADRVIKKAEAQGVNVLDKAQGEPIGKMINSMTGRGNIGRLDAFGKQINATIFSIKFLKSNFDTLTAHQFQKGVTPFVRKEAAKNLLKIGGSLAGIYFTANKLSPGSVELDPRSSKFGKIKYKDTTFDPTGGMASLVTLASRLTPTYHNGKWGWFTKNAKGEVTELGTGKYGVKNALDVFTDFTEGKFAPYAALIRDLLKGEDFQGRKAYMDDGRLPKILKPAARIIPNPRTILQAHAPIPAQNFVETMKNPNAAPLLMTTILDGLGISANTYTPPDKNPTAEKIKKLLGGGEKRQKTPEEQIRELLKKGP